MSKQNQGAIFGARCFGRNADARLLDIRDSPPPPLPPPPPEPLNCTRSLEPCVSAVVAVGDIGDTLVEAIEQRLDKVSVGDGLEPGSEMGPLITAEHRDRVAGYVDAGAAQGASVVRDGRDQHFDGEGFFLHVEVFLFHTRPQAGRARLPAWFARGTATCLA